MAKFRFPLEKVFSHRRTLENLAQKDFHEALAILNSEIVKLDFMMKEKTDAFELRFQRQVQGGLASQALTQVHEYLKGQDVRIDRQKKKIQEIEKQVEELRDALRQRAVDTKIIERLKERKQEEFRLEQRKLEQKRLDDLTSTRFARGDERDENGI